MRRALALVLVALAPLVGAPAPRAQMNATILWDQGTHYSGPGDIATYSAWYGLRCYSAAVAATGTQKVITLRRDSDNTTHDILCLNSGAIDLAAASSFCSGVGCWAQTVYDQTNGNACGAASCDVTQGTNNRQPQFIFNCNGTLPCLETTLHGLGNFPVGLVGANAFTPSATISVSAVGVVVDDTSILFFIRQNGGGVANQNRNGIEKGGSTDKWALVAGSGTLQGAATKGIWQSAAGALNINGSTSTLNVGGTETTSAGLTPSSTAGAPDIAWVPSFNPGTIRWAEGGFEDNTLWDGTKRTALCHNQRIYWNTTGTC